MFFRSASIALSVAGMLVAAAGPAYAQATSQRQARPLFGGASGTPDHSFDVTLNLIEAYDDNILAESGSITPTSPAIGGLFTMFGADGAYNWRGQRTQFGLTGGTLFRYYNDTKEVIPAGTMGVGFSTELARRTTFSANQTVAYSPSYLTGLFAPTSTPEPGDATAIGPDYSVNDQSSYFYGTSLSVSRGITRRGTLSASVDYRYTDFISEAEGRSDQATTQARVQFGHGVSRNTSLRLAYRYRNGDVGTNVVGYVPGGKSSEQGFDVGLDYIKPLSATRRFVFGFGVGSSAADLPITDLAGAALDSRQYSVLADATMAYQFRRSWEARVSYRRGLEFVPEIAEPVYTDAFSTVLSGLMTPTLDFTAGFSLSTGESAAFRSSNQAAFDTYTASVRVRRAVTKTLALYGEYLYYFYDFGATQLQPGVPSTMERNGVRAGLTLWLPVMRR